MMAVALISWILACYGATLIVTSGRILESARRLIDSASPFLGHGVRCPMCVGFWTGVVMPHGPFANPIMCGAASSASVWMIHVALAKLGAEEL